MKKKKPEVTVYKNDIVIYDGRLLELPIKDKYITQRSIELFDDDDPCIIHKSYIMKDFSDTILSLFKDNKTTTLKGIDFPEKFEVIDFIDTDKLVIKLKG